MADGVEIRPVLELIEAGPSGWTRDEAGFLWGYAIAFAEEVLDDAKNAPTEIALESKMRAFGLLLTMASVVLPLVPEGLWTWEQIRPSLARYEEVVQGRLARGKLHLGREVN